MTDEQQDPTSPAPHPLRLRDLAKDRSVVDAMDVWKAARAKLGKPLEVPPRPDRPDDDIRRMVFDRVAFSLRWVSERGDYIPPSRVVEILSDPTAAEELSEHLIRHRGEVGVERAAKVPAFERAVAALGGPSCSCTLTHRRHKEGPCTRTDLRVVALVRGKIRRLKNSRVLWDVAAGQYPAPVRLLCAWCYSAEFRRLADEEQIRIIASASEAVRHAAGVVREADVPRVGP